jgi:hypothetical protein
MKKLPGIRRRRPGGRRQAYVRVRGVVYSRTFPDETPIADMLAWRASVKADNGIHAAADVSLDGTLRAVQDFLCDGHPDHERWATAIATARYRLRH